MPRTAPRAAPTARLASVCARVLAALGLFPLVLRLADRLTLLRDRAGRPRFPYVRAARERAYQILLFHRVNDDGDPFFGLRVAAFRANVKLLARHWNILPLRELVDLAATKALPRRAAAITFDDGYRDNYEFAYPILTEYRLPATIFLATGAIESGRPLWHDRVFDAFRRTRVPRLAVGGAEFPLDTDEERRRALHALLNDLRARTPEGRELGIRAALAALSLEENSELGNRMLTWAQIRELNGAGIDFGAHSVSHPILTRMPLKEALREILDSRREIEGRLSARVDLFAYPNGSPGDFSEPIKEGLRAAGFRAAVTTIWGKNDAASDPFELRRVGPWGADPRVAALRLGWYRVSG